MSDGSFWYVGIHGQQQGPLSTPQIIEMIRAGQLGQTAYVYGQTLPQWTPIAQVAQFAGQFGQAPPLPPPPPVGPAPVMADIIEFELGGGDLQFVEIVLDPGEAAIADAGSLFYMAPGIRLEPMFGDGSQPQQGLFGSLAHGARRVQTGELLAMTAFGNAADERQKVAFAAPSPGKVIPIDLRQHGETLLVQQDAFLCVAKGITVSVASATQLGDGPFGRADFVLYELDGNGLAFIHAGGAIVARQLQSGEALRVDTSSLIACERTVGHAIERSGGLPSMVFGGADLFTATLTGPGWVWLQSLPFSKLAGRMLAAAATTGSSPGNGGAALDGARRGS